MSRDPKLMRFAINKTEGAHVENYEYYIDVDRYHSRLNISIMVDPMDALSTNAELEMQVESDEDLELRNELVARIIAVMKKLRIEREK